MSGSSTTLTNSDNDPRRDIRATGMDGQRSMGLGVEIWRTGSLLDVFLLLSSLLLFLGSRPGTNGVRMCFTTSGSQSMGGGVSPCARSAERSRLSCTNWVWDFSVRTIAYIECLFHSLFPFPSFLLYWLWHPRRSAPKERDNVTARSHVTCPGPYNPHSIKSSCHEP